MYLIMFSAGACIMIMELTGSRVLAPYVGTSVFVWTSLIGVILASISLGYWLGGHLADRRQDTRVLAGLLGAAGAYIGLVVLVKDGFLYGLADMNMAIALKSFVAVVLLFSVPNVLLAMVAPYIVKLRIRDLDSCGQTVGRLYALSTLGSIAGTFGAGYVLIPFMGTTPILLLIAVVLMALALIVWGTFRWWVKAAVMVIVSASAVWAGRVQPQWMPHKTPVVDIETLYNRVWIYNAQNEQGDLIKIMRINHEGNTAVYLFKQGLVAEYLKYYRLAEHFHPDFRRTLMLGGAGYAYPQDYLKRFPEARMDVVEIDPELTRLAKQHFGLKDDPRLNIIHQDARMYLNQTDKEYDVILVDAFNSLSVLPYQITTREAVERMSRILNERGVVMVNMISALEGDRGLFTRAQYATYKKVFPQVFLLRVEPDKPLDAVQNVMLVAVKSRAPVTFQNADAQLQQYLQNRVVRRIDQDVPVLTDDHAPVAYYMGKALRP
jgi:spermidine synthase